MKKTERLGLRVTPKEKENWKRIAKQEGYSSLSEWIAATLNKRVK